MPLPGCSRGVELRDGFTLLVYPFSVVSQLRVFSVFSRHGRVGIMLRYVFFRPIIMFLPISMLQLLPCHIPAFCIFTRVTYFNVILAFLYMQLMLLIISGLGVIA